MSPLAKIQYISDRAGKQTGVIVPIDLWRDVFAGQVAESGGPGPTSPSKPRQEAWQSLLSCADQIAASWGSPESVVDLVDKQRR